MARVLIAPDSFKGSVDAPRAAEAIAAGWRTVRADDELVLLPQADGGEGTAAAVAVAHPEGTWHTLTVTGPDGFPTTAAWFRCDDRTAVADIAEAAGLPKLATPDALGTTSRGVGELLAAIAAAGISELRLGLGGSACTDGGAGALAGLGVVLLDADGAPLPDGGGALAHVSTVDGLPVPFPAAVTLVTDVTAPLLGPGGAAAVFGPQKGAGPDDVVTLERGLRRWADLVGGDPDQPGAGAAGGLGYGLVAGIGATIVDGAAWVARSTGLAAAVPDADLVITGEGRFDATSLLGKVVGHGLALAHAADVRSRIVAGQVDRTVAVPGTSAGEPIALVELAGGVGPAIADPVAWLTAAGAAAAAQFAD